METAEISLIGVPMGIKKITFVLMLMTAFSATGFSAYTISSLDVVNLSTTAPLYGDNWVICRMTEAGSSGGAPSIYVALQYNTGGGTWANLSSSNANNVSTSSTNPNVTSQKGGTVDFLYDVYTLIPGSGNQFRCNGTDGTNYKISGVYNMTIGTPQLYVTNLSIAPTNASSQNLPQNALFNVTATIKCNNSDNTGTYGANCGSLNASLYYNATASYPNALVSNVSGATPFFLVPQNKRQSSYAATAYYFLQGVQNPTNAFDNAFGDTTDYAIMYTNSTDLAYLNVSYKVNLSSSTYIYYTIETYAYYLSVYAYNWTSGAFQLINNATTGSSPHLYSNHTDPSWVNSTGGILYQFAKETYSQTAYVYDVYLAEAANPETCSSVASGANCSATWQVNATRSSGNYWLNVSFFSNSSYINPNSTGNFQINTTDVTGPNIGNFKFNVSNMSNYSAAQGYQFNATVNDETGISYVWIEHNFTGTLTNYTATGNVSSEYYYNYGTLSPGFYYMKWYANDSSNNHNLNNSDYVHYYQLQPGNGWLNVSYQSPLNGSNQNVTQNNTFNVVMNVTCVGGYCGNVNGTLRYNKSAGLNPDTKVNTTTGATPFYTLPSVFETNISDPGAAVYSVALGDANNDGKNEVVIATNAGPSLVRMYTNTSGGWVETNITSSPSSVESVVIGDANNDGKNEVVIGTYGPSEVLMYQNISGGWVETNISNEPTMVYPVAIGDANNDGQNEVVIGMIPVFGESNMLRMYQNMSGGWTETIIGNVQATVYSVAVGDANNDGKNEIASVGNAKKVMLYENMSGSWVETDIKDEPTNIYSVAIGDANNDGKNETVIGMWSTNNETRMYENKSGGWIETNISDESNDVYSVTIGDADNDGKNEVAIGIDTTPYKVKMYKNESGRWVQTNISNGQSDYVYSVVIGDADNDGKNETIIGTDAGTNPVRMYDVFSNPLYCDPLFSGQTCTVSWTVDATGTPASYWLDANFTSDYAYVPANDSGNFQINITSIIVPPLQYGWLKVSYQSPASGSSQSVAQNNTFNVTMNVTCVGGDCGAVNATLRYNMSAGLNPNANISTVVGATPFYNMSGSNPYQCGSLTQGQICQLNWTINATGTPGSQYWLDANFTSNYSQVPANDSGNFQINIVIPGYLNVILVNPTGDLSAVRNRVFNITARVTCSSEAGTNCYLVNATSFDNLTSAYPNNVLGAGDPYLAMTGSYSEPSSDDEYTILRMHMGDTGLDSATTVYDETNRNSGTKLGDGSPAWSEGMFGSGLRFDGFDDYFNVSSISDLNTYSNNLTIMFWFKPSTNTIPNGTTVLARNWDGTGNNSYWIYFSNDSGPELIFSITIRGTNHDVRGSGGWTAGVWHQVAVTFDGSYIKFYLDSNLKSTTDLTVPKDIGGDIDKSDNILIVGAKNGSVGAGHFNGTIDELAIYNRTMSVSEITNDYMANPLSCYMLTNGQSCKVVWSVNASGGLFTQWLMNITFNSNDSSVFSNSTRNFKVSIGPIPGCNEYVNCAYPNCQYYSDRTTTIQSTDGIQKVWSSARTCWS